MLKNVCVENALGELCLNTRLLEDHGHIPIGYWSRYSLNDSALHSLTTHLHSHVSPWVLTPSEPRPASTPPFPEARAAASVSKS